MPLAVAPSNRLCLHVVRAARRTKGEGLVVPLNADAVLMACTKESMSWTALQRKGTVR